MKPVSTDSDKVGESAKSVGGDNNGALVQGARLAVGRLLTCILGGDNSRLQVPLSQRLKKDNAI